ncbi:hypothetical protein [Escherichia coli]|uniref:hypothetical protein n=1 Tax=Escherichia coli TaxID=562 RepID=UPI00201F4906|nr:hypothetical protein [Escherichia coli]
MFRRSDGNTSISPENIAGQSLSVGFRPLPQTTPISLIIDDASIQKNEDNKYIFINNNTNKETDDPFESTERNLAAYLSKSSGIEALFQDVNALQKWLLQSGFISGGIATEKMLITNKL